MLASMYKLGVQAAVAEALDPVEQSRKLLKAWETPVSRYRILLSSHCSPEHVSANLTLRRGCRPSATLCTGVAPHLRP